MGILREVVIPVPPGGLFLNYSSPQIIWCDPPKTHVPQGQPPWESVHLGATAINSFVELGERLRTTVIRNMQTMHEFSVILCS